MMAAITAADGCRTVALYEKNPRLGRKLLLTGKGRCNVTNVGSLDAYWQHFSRQSKFLRDAFCAFFHQDLMRFFAQRGLPLKVERQQRVFPQTDKAESVLWVLKQELIRRSVQIYCENPVRSIRVENGCVTGVRDNTGKNILAHRVVLATGGKSYPVTGSTGDGYKMAGRWGHTLVPLRPALVGLETRSKIPSRLQGVVLKNVILKFQKGKKKVLSPVGELLFTDFGVSGPLVISLSGKIADWLEQGAVTLFMDLKPGLDRQKLEARMQREIDSGPRVLIKNFLKKFFPSAFSAVFVDWLKLEPAKQANQITQSERKRIIAAMKSLRLDIARARPLAQAMVTQGGIPLKEIDPKTMESRLIKGLYFAGEIIDVDADTGGFNLQAAFSTGYLAGQSASGNPQLK